ncbi:hypothetical protein [Rheinheimera sp.]|uniref:hypothetical protein n=1 Tax=Rheinheimera sp. TaxID=1869214 RepID=UPI0040474E91
MITQNNPAHDIHQLLETLKAFGFTYARAQLEQGENGTRHIQACFGGKKCRLPQISKLLPHTHVEIAKSPYDSWEYCGKVETRVEGPVEFGIPPAAKNRAGDTRKKNAMLLEKGAVAAVNDGDIPLL